MTRLLLLSNGHGEDLSGALLGRQLLGQPGLEIAALPLVGHGEPYRQAGIPVLGRTRSFSTGGLGYTSLRGRLTELLQGQVLYLLRQLRRLWRQRRRTDLVVIVGDVVPLLAWWVTGLPGVVYLVAYSSHYEGRLRLPWPCGWLLQRRRMRQVWSRDALTATDLSQQLGRPVSFLGNPFLDLVVAQPGEAAPEPSPPGGAGAPQRVALLPGSRLPEARQNLELMLRLLTRLPAPLQRPGRLRLQAALVRELASDDLAALAERLDWRLVGSVLERGDLRLELVWGGFAAVLRPADLVVAMAGTATEQAVGLGKPVLQLAGQGPQFTAGFAEAQRRLLGPGVVCAAGEVGASATLEASAGLVEQLLATLADPSEGPELRRRLDQVGRERIGTAAGTERMAAAIMAALPPDPAPRHG
ncbi:MAG: lipid-A-disaccharide synthase-related protein [Synechococcus sp.]